MSPNVTITAIVPEPQPQPQPQPDGAGAAAVRGSAGDAAGSGSPASPSTPASPSAPALPLRSATLKVTTFTANAGTTLSVTLARASKLTVTLKRQAAGHKVGKRCVAGRKAHAKRCTAVVTKTLTFAGRSGLNRLAFGKRLPRGKYTATVTAVGGGAPVTLRFTVRRRDGPPPLGVASPDARWKKTNFDAIEDRSPPDVADAVALRAQGPRFARARREPLHLRAGRPDALAHRHREQEEAYVVVGGSGRRSSTTRSSSSPAGTCCASGRRCCASSRPAPTASR